MPNVNANDSISYFFKILFAKKANPQVKKYASYYNKSICKCKLVIF